MNSRALTVPLLVCFILGSYVVVVEQAQAGAEPSPSAKANRNSATASARVRITNLQSHTTEGETFSGTADLYANTYPRTVKRENQEVSATIGVKTVSHKVWVGAKGGVAGYEQTVTSKKSYIKASRSPSVYKLGVPLYSKWALAKATVSGTFKRRWSNYMAPDSGSGS